MWIIETAYDNTPERVAGRPAHRARLADLHEEGLIRMAGPWGDDSGALIIADVPDRRAVDDLLAQDPFLSAPGVRVVSIRQWNPFLV